MKKQSFVLVSLVAAALAGCGNGVPSISAFSLTVTGKDNAGNRTLEAKVTASDPDEGDRITRFEISGSGPAAIATPAVQVPEGLTITDLPVRLTLPAAAPAGTYTFSIKAYDEAGEPSTAATATVDIP